MVNRLTKYYQFTNVNIIFVFLILLNFSSSKAETTKDSSKFSNREIVWSWLLKHTHLKYSVDGNYSSGNVNRFLFAHRVNFYYLYKIYEFNLTTSNTYGKQNNIKTENDYYYGITTNFWQESPTYLWGNISEEKSFLRAFSRRSILGIGTGFNLLKKQKKKQLSLTYGFMYEYTNFFYLNDIETIRLSIRFKGKHQLFKNKVNLSHETFLQPSVLDAHNYRYRTLITLEFPFNKYLSLRTTYSQNYENIVSPEKKNTDRTVNFGLSFTY
ncbi:MAG: DUF481 domain-containing protein [Cytophagales bacterium]